MSIPIIKKKKLSLISHRWLACLSQKRSEIGEKLPRLKQKTRTANVLIQEQETVFGHLPKGELEGLQIRHYDLRADEPDSCNKVVIGK